MVRYLVLGTSENASCRCDSLCNFWNFYFEEWNRMSKTHFRKLNRDVKHQRCPWLTHVSQFTSKPRCWSGLNLSCNWNRSDFNLFQTKVLLFYAFANLTSGSATMSGNSKSLLFLLQRCVAVRQLTLPVGIKSRGRCGFVPQRTWTSATPAVCLQRVGQLRCSVTTSRYNLCTKVSVSSGAK